MACKWSISPAPSTTSDHKCFATRDLKENEDSFTTENQIEVPNIIHYYL